MARFRTASALLLATRLAMSALVGCSSGDGDANPSPTSELTGGSDGSTNVGGSAEVIYGADGWQRFDLTNCVSDDENSAQGTGPNESFQVKIDVEGGTGTVSISASDEVKFDSSVAEAYVESDGYFTARGKSSDGVDFTVNGTCSTVNWS